jgi:hypothetical protein
MLPIIIQILWTRLYLWQYLATGYSGKFNAGDIENKGVELSLFGAPIGTEIFLGT